MQEGVNLAGFLQRSPADTKDPLVGETVTSRVEELKMLYQQLQDLMPQRLRDPAPPVTSRTEEEDKTPVHKDSVVSEEVELPVVKAKEEEEEEETPPIPVKIRRTKADQHRTAEEDILKQLTVRAQKVSRTHTHTYIHTNIHTSIRTYIHTFIRTYMYIYAYSLLHSIINIWTRLLMRS